MLPRFPTVWILSFLFAAAAALAGCSPDDREPSPAEPSALGGAALLARGESFADRGKEAGAREAYDQALAAFRVAGDLSGQANALLGIANLTRATGQGEVSRDIYADAKAKFAAAGDEVGETRVVLAVGELERARFNNEEALAAFTEASSAFRAHDERLLEARALLGIADSERRLGNVVRAEAAAGRAHAVFDVVGDRSGLNAAEQLMEELKQYVSEYEDLQASWAIELADADLAHDEFRQALSKLGLAGIAIQAGKVKAVRQLIGAARPKFAEIGIANGVLASDFALGELEYRLGRADEARASLALVLEAYPEAALARLPEDRVVEEKWPIGAADRAALASIRLGELNADPSRFELTSAVLAAARRPADLVAATALARGRLALQDGRLDEAAALFMEARAGFSASGFEHGVARALLASGDQSLATGDADAAREYFAEALKMFLAEPDRFGQADAHWGLAEALWAKGDAVEAGIEYRIAGQIFRELELLERALTAARVAGP
jgi:tetratricopeptide (TPR) repeat protein